MWRKIFRLYTKTFGGKIWFDLHRVSPGNVFDKNLKKAFLKISHQIYLSSNSCTKLSFGYTKIQIPDISVKMNFFSSVYKFEKRKLQFSCTRYHDIYKDCKLKSTMARYEQLKRNYLFTLKFLKPINVFSI